jgi:ATP-dependent DNA ligase
VLVAFDLLYLNGHDLRKLPLHTRKSELKQIIDGTPVQFSESFEIDGQEMYQHACKLGLEGVVSKVRDSAYASGRGNSWVKKTCQQRETLTIAGFALDGEKWDGIYLARRRGKDLVYAGKVDHGVRQKLGRSLAQTADAAHPQDTALCQTDRALRHLGRTEAACRDRVSHQVRRAEGAASLLPRSARGRLRARLDKLICIAVICTPSLYGWRGLTDSR